MVSKKVIPLFLAGFMILSGPAFAQNPPVTTAPTTSSSSSSSSVVRDAVCDPTIFTRMRQKAWMEAQRENYTNQSLILKPVSGFALTCYDKQLGQSLAMGVKEKSGSTTNTTRYENTVKTSAGQVASGLVGNLAMGPGSSAPEASYNSNITKANTDSNGNITSSFSCDEMSKLWTQSQCGNFQGGYLASLTEVSSGSDSRGYPTACTTGKNDTSGSTNAGDYAYSKALSDIYAPGASTEFDELNLHLCDTLPYSQLTGTGSSGNGCKKECKTVPTARIVDGKNEAFCPNPGCHPEPSGSDMKCVPDKT